MTVVLVVRRQSYIGLSSDAKPVGTAGSTFYETDTGSLYVFDGVDRWTRNPPLYSTATIPIPLGEQMTALPAAAARRSRDYTHLQHARGTT